MERSLINFCANNVGHSHEIIDALYGYYQSCDDSHQSWVDIKMSSSFDAQADLNVYLDYMPGCSRDLSMFDMVIYSNGCEPLSVSTQTIHDDLYSDNKFYLACNSYLDSSHEMVDKIIWSPSNILNLRDFWCRPFTSSFYENHRSATDIKRKNSMIFINGRPDSWRHHLSVLLESIVPDVHQRSTISDSVHETKDSFFESREDKKFREEINQLYDPIIIRNLETTYYDNSILCGIEGKFGEWPLGYFILPEYYSYHCVIFPESTWQNDELAITEKILKCFYAGCFPWPVGGSNINRMYNEVGFYTAWNLLPDHLKTFDCEKDHMRRYNLMVDAIGWLSKNQHVMVATDAREMLQSNLRHFLTCGPEIIGVKKFDKIIRRLLEKK